MKKLFLFFVTLLVFGISYLLVNKVYDYLHPSESFIYGLKTKAIKKIVYLAESNSTILPINQNTVALYTVKKNSFETEEIFRIAGIAYAKIKNILDAKDASIIFIDLSMDKPVTLTRQEKDFLYNFVGNGGMLIGVDALTTRFGVLKSLFGYKGFASSKKRKSFFLLDSEYFDYFDTKEEREYRLSGLKEASWTNAIELGSAKALALFDDKSTAISINRYKKGYAMLLGISLFDLRYRNLFGKDLMANKNYINHLEPISDFIILLLKGIYQVNIKKSIFLHTSPNGKQATFIMTHDVDFQDSIGNIEPFVKLENKLGIKASYNILTKYITDDKDKAFFSPSNLHYILDAEKKGFEIGDHTVLHSKNFFLFPKGTCKESYPSYKPFSMGEFSDIGNPTLCGEIKVSKELLLGAGVKKVDTFRSGELLYNPKLPEVLEELGFKYSSCFSAEDVLSYFPYRYMKNYANLSNPSKIFEIPLVYEDEHFPPLYFRVKKAFELFKKVYDNGGVFTVLDHNDMTWWKLKNLDPYFIEQLVSMIPKDTWFPTMGTFGDFWNSRDRVVFRYNIGNGELNLRLYSLSDVKGLTFVLNHFYIINDKNKTTNKLILDIKKGMNQWHFPIKN